MTVREYFEGVAEQKGLTLRELAEDVLGVPYKTLYSQLRTHDGMGLTLEKVVSYLDKTGGQLVFEGFEPPTEDVIDGFIDN